MDAAFIITLELQPHELVQSMEIAQEIADMVDGQFNVKTCVPWTRPVTGPVTNPLGSAILPRQETQ